jgi:nucleotide-binding universal stress UspA family protein
MSLIQNILVATDFSKGADKAVQRAASLAAIYQCKRAELININEGGKPQTAFGIKDSVFDEILRSITEAAWKDLGLKAAESRAKYGIEFACTFRFGQASKEIINRAEEIDADLIITGAHERNPLPDFFFGTTIDKLIRLSRRPLLIVKNDPTPDYRRILVLIDFSKDSRQAARTALIIAPSASFTFLHACEVEHEGKMHFAGVDQAIIDDYRLKEYEHAVSAMQNLIEELHAPDRLITQQIVFDKPGAAVRKYSEQANPDLIVVGKHGRSRIEELLIGSVTRDAIAWTNCDILVVPPATDRSMDRL